MDTVNVNRDHVRALTEGDRCPVCGIGDVSTHCTIVTTKRPCGILTCGCGAAFHPASGRFDLPVAK